MMRLISLKALDSNMTDIGLYHGYVASSHESSILDFRQPQPLPLHLLTNHHPLTSPHPMHIPHPHSHKILLIPPHNITPLPPLIIQLLIPPLPSLPLLPPLPPHPLLLLPLPLRLSPLLGPLRGHIFFLRGLEFVGGSEFARFFEAVYGCVEAGGDECFFGLWVWLVGGFGVGWGGEGRGRNEMGWLGTFLLSWKPTWPVAMPAFLCRFAHGV